MTGSTTLETPNFFAVFASLARFNCSLSWAFLSSDNGARAFLAFFGFSSTSTGADVWEAADTTPYTSEVVIDGTATTLIGSADNYTTAFNSDARSDLKDDNVFGFLAMEYDQFYLNDYDGGYGVSSTGHRLFYSSETDNSDTSKRPYLDVTVGGGAAVTYNANFFGTNF